MCSRTERGNNCFVLVGVEAYFKGISDQKIYRREGKGKGFFENKKSNWYSFMCLLFKEMLNALLYIHTQGFRVCGEEVV